MSDNKYSGTVKIKTGLLFVLFLLSAQISNSQPQWVSGPTSTPGVITVDVTFTLNQAGKVYYGAYPYYSAGVLSSSQVQLFGLWGAGGSCDHNVFNYTTPGVPATITVTGFPANRMVTIYMVAEGPTGTLQDQPTVLYPITLPCPPIRLFTFFANLGECVNTGATAMYQVGTVNGPTGPLPTGVLKGTTFTVNWGDGTTGRILHRPTGIFRRHRSIPSPRSTAAPTRDPGLLKVLAMSFSQIPVFSLSTAAILNQTVTGISLWRR
jgi:hypothetical protein